jgi:hypothetical protein
LTELGVEVKLSEKTTTNTTSNLSIFLYSMLQVMGQYFTILKLVVGLDATELAGYVCSPAGLQLVMQNSF